MQQTYNRAAEDLGNAVHLEHVNVNIPDQRLATLFYVTGLGLTRDPYLLALSDDNMWVNVGRGQPVLSAVRLGATPARPHRDRDLGRQALWIQARFVPRSSKGRSSTSPSTTTTSRRYPPWAENQIRCHEPDAARFGRIALGIPYVEFDVPPGSAKGIAAFYAQMIETPAEVVEDGTLRASRSDGTNSVLPRDRAAAAGVRRASLPDLRGQFFRPVPSVDGEELGHDRGQQISVSLPRHRRSRVRPSPVHDRARGAQHDASELLAAADQPQPRPDRPHLLGGPRSVDLVDAAGAHGGPALTRDRHRRET